MIEIVCNENIEEVLNNPSEYISYIYDKALVKYYKEDSSNPTWILLGIDEDDRYYFTIEDNDVSDDYYLSSNESLLSLFIRLLEKIIKED